MLARPPVTAGFLALPRGNWRSRRREGVRTRECQYAQLSSAGGDGQAASSDDALPNLGTRTDGEDWPGFLGPQRNGRSAETGILTGWSNDRLRIVWKRAVGAGYGIGSVSKGRFFHFDRHEQLERLTCLHAETGEELWRFEYPTNYVDSYGYGDGPRCSPVVDGDRVYIFGAEGQLHCLRAGNGAVVWHCDTNKLFGVVPNLFGVGSTPLVEGELLIAVVGGSPAEDQQVPRDQIDRVRGNGSGIVAFDKRTGEVRYTLTSELAGYASPIAATIDGRRRCFAFCRGGLVVFDPLVGATHFRYPWRSPLLESVNACTPIVEGNEVLITEAYGPGCSLLSVQPGGYFIEWHDDPRVREKIMKCQFGTPIYHEGYLYGCSGRYPRNAELRCVEWKTGEVKWSQPRSQRCSLMYVDQHLICLTERGTLQLLRADPLQYELVTEIVLREVIDGEKATGHPPPILLEYPCWSAPILAHGLLYVRSKNLLVCLDLIPARERP